MPVSNIQLQNALHKPYDRVLFAKEVLSPVFGPGFSLGASLIPAPVMPNKTESVAIDQVWIYGSVQLDDGTDITCYEVLLQPSVRIEHSKVAIQQYIRKLLISGQAALINFVAPANRNVWRLTLVAKDSMLTDKGVKEKTTNAKRYTFLLGPSEACKTAAERFEVLSTEKEITFQTLVNAFSVEKLSKAFFDEYTLHYQHFCDYLQESNYRKSVFNISFAADATKQEKDKASKPIRDFVKKLLGRIVFLYFVQKKGWLGASDTHYTDGVGDFIRQLFHKSGGNDTFYSNWLTVLFFDTLNKERANDDFSMPDGKMVKVPFLNGGLFDKEEFDEHLLTFPAKLFHCPDFEDEILTTKSNGHSRGFLDFLDAFNFTVYEDSPDDHTVAVDPEMLGHIFENLLEDNKDKGAFYTPKEIVHYMCQESLTEYLCTTLQIKDEVAEREAVNQLLKNKVVDDVLKSEITELEAALDQVKICDPAIGSGAFPMGLLQEIFSIKELIAYETGKAWKPAETKLNIIQNAIYGVDIEKGAVDIARLRFWLSLVVDEEKPKALPNLDYKIVVGDSLISKFDGEIVEIDWERKRSVGKADEYVKNLQRLLVEVADRQKHYFNPHNKHKKKLQTEIRQLKIELLINQLSLNKANYLNKNQKVTDMGLGLKATDHKKNLEIDNQIAGFDKLILKLKSLLTNTEEPFNHFDWKLDFPEVLNPYLVGEDGGFDIVIGNPPYLRIQGLRKTNPKFADFITNYFEAATGSFDLYAVFAERSFALTKANGILNFIMPVKWTNAAFGKGLRKFISKQNAANKIISFAAHQVFNASTYTALQWFRRGSSTLSYIELDRPLKSKTALGNFLFGIKQTDFAKIIPDKTTVNPWQLVETKSKKILEKIETHDRKLSDIFEKIFQGIATSKDGVYFLFDCVANENTIIGFSKELERRIEIEKEITRPLLKGDDVHRYCNISTSKAVIFPYKYSTVNGIESVNLYTENEISSQFPLAYAYFKECENILRERENGRFNIDGEWFQYGRKQGIQYAPKEKLVAPDISLGSNFAYDYNGDFYQTTTIYGYIKRASIKESYKFLIAILNSKVLWWYLVNTGTVLSNGYFRFKPDYIKPFPIPKLNDIESEKAFINIVDYILYLKSNDKPMNEYVPNSHITETFEEVLDAMVFELYFPKEFENARIYFTKYATRDFESIVGKESEVQKEIIHNAYQKLREKDNEIRNNLKAMKIELRDLLMPILTV